ncbi:MAG: hypothetical protein A2144_05350 [Chloroflexi bacterium RBG_16_50_9]|nr:MAG: hypothetical protein A2144_05350 [Chloroflexi bacterium RBG_16_50_9]
MTDKLLSEASQLSLLEPVAAYKIYHVSRVSHDRLWLDNGTVIRSTFLPTLLSERQELAVIVATIGPGLEKQVTDCFSRGEPLRGALLDGIGSAAVDSLTQEVCKLIAVEAASRSYQVSSPISPGMPGFPIAEQPRLFKLAPAQEIGVSLTSSCVMIPRKSASMVIGIGSQMKTWTQAEVCACCHLNSTCLYKIHA